MKIGIIVCRFQCSYLHEAHVKLIEYVQQRNDKLFVFIGVSSTRLTHNNPLDFESRQIMFHDLYPEIDLLPIHDKKSDYVWSRNLDSEISSVTNHDDDVTLYGSRDSFLKCYHGNFKTEFISDIIIEGLSSTNIREALYLSRIDHQQKREAIIWASNHRFPVCYQTVDVAIINYDTKQILLGRKLNELKFRFIGGFTDPELDDSLESSAKREATEECGQIETSDYKYICSLKIDDWRYRKSKDKIMTAFFVCSFIFGNPSSNDDINELRWYDISDLVPDIFEEEHIPLFEKLTQYLN